MRILFATGGMDGDAHAPTPIGCSAFTESTGRCAAWTLTRGTAARYSLSLLGRRSVLRRRCPADAGARILVVAANELVGARSRYEKDDVRGLRRHSATQEMSGTNARHLEGNGR